MAKEAVRCKTIESSVSPKMKGPWWPVVILVLSGGALVWIADHLAGDCINTIADATKWCPLN